MALYEGLNSADAAPAPVVQRWTSVHARTSRREAEPATSFLDRLLGQGSSHTLGRAVGTTLARVRRPAAVESPAVSRPPRVAWQTQRMQAVGAGEGALPRGRKGLGRMVLVLVG